MAMQIRPKCRQITNPKFINFFSSSSSSFPDSNLNENNSSSSSKNNKKSTTMFNLQDLKESLLAIKIALNDKNKRKITHGNLGGLRGLMRSRIKDEEVWYKKNVVDKPNENTQRKSPSLSSLASLFSDVKTIPKHHLQQQQHERSNFQSLVNWNRPSSVYSLLRSSEQSPTKKEFLDEVRNKVVDSRLSSADPPVSPSSTNDSLKAALSLFKKANLLASTRESSKQSEPSGGENVNHVGLAHFFQEQLISHQDEQKSGSETQRLTGSDALPAADKEMSQKKEESSSVPDGLKTDLQENKGRAKKLKVWAATQDRMLVDTLLELHSEGLYHADNGFKRSALKEMESRLDIKMPGYELKGSQRIVSRMRRLKTQWYAVHDLLTGQNCSGFGWDAEKKYVTAEDNVWDAYVKAHPEAAKLRNASFPYYDDLCVIWAKDTATGTDDEIDAGSLTDDIVEELDGMR